VIWYVAEKVEGEWMIKGLDDGFREEKNKRLRVEETDGIESEPTK
jgi:hypothetical protein